MMKQMRIKINKAKAMFTGSSPRHTQATTAGHQECTKPGADTRALKEETGQVMCMKKPTNGPFIRAIRAKGAKNGRSAGVERILTANDN
jgi:hypothetical protein